MAQRRGPPVKPNSATQKVLRLLHYANGRLSTSDIASALGAPFRKTGKLLSYMAQDGLITNVTIAPSEGMWSLSEELMRPRRRRRPRSPVMPTAPRTWFQV